MNNTKKGLYKRIYAELFEILDTLKDEEIEKIPKKVKLNIIDNMKSNTLLNSNSESKMNLNYNKYNNNDDLLNMIIQRNYKIKMSCLKLKLF